MEKMLSLYRSQTIHVYPNVSAVSFEDCDNLKYFSLKALPLCLQNPGPGECVLADLEEIEISLISDMAIAEIHRQFLNDPDPTDVITFHHGEILVSYDTAKRNAPEVGNKTMDELFLYIVHGLLHLNGHLDGDSASRTRMETIQNEIWEEVLGNGQS